MFIENLEILLEHTVLEKELLRKYVIFHTSLLVRKEFFLESWVLMVRVDLHIHLLRLRSSIEEAFQTKEYLVVRWRKVRS